MQQLTFKELRFQSEDPSMNFELNCIRREQRNFEQSRESLAQLNLRLCHKEKITSLSVPFFFSSRKEGQ